MARKPQAAPKSFEEAIGELETILNRIEKGETGLEESLLQYERGNFLIQHCRQVLDGAEKQIQVITRADEQGVETEPMKRVQEEAGDE